MTASGPTRESLPFGVELVGRLRPQSIAARYALAVAAVVAALALRILLTPLTGRGAPFVIFFGATLITSLLAGGGPAALCLALSLPIAVRLFVLPEGYAMDQAVFQAVLYGADGLIIIVLTTLMHRWQHHVEAANRRLREANTQREAALARTRETIDLAPDAYFLADLSASFIDVNQAACRLLGYDRDELLGMTIVDLISAEDVPRLETQRAALMVPGTVLTNEWELKNKDGTFIPVEVSANILRDGRWQAFIRDITERRRIIREMEAANAQLRESEERFRLTIDEAPIGMALVALDGRFERVNNMLCEITGYSAEELTRLTFQDITHPDDLAKDVELSQQLAKGDIPRYQLEKRYIRKDGSTVIVVLSASVLRTSDGTARYYIVRVEDITARKRADDALRLSEAKFSGIVSIAADAIISVDGQQRITIFNEGAERIFGYSRSEVLGTPLERLIPERFREAHREHFARFAAGSETARKMGERRDIFGLRKSGEEFPAEASISRVGVNGTKLFSVVLRDITDRKTVEESLRRSASDLRTAQRVAHVGSWRWNIRVGEVEWSEELYRILGVNPAVPVRPGILLSPESKILTDESKERMRAAVDKTLSDGSPYEIDLEFTRPDGSGGWVVARGEVVRDETGEIIGINGTAADVTALKELQRLRDEWTSVIAHDLRQPIGTILMASDFLPAVHGPELSDKERALAERIHSAAQALKRMVDDLLDMSLLEAHRLKLEPKWTNPHDLVRETLERLSHLRGIDRVHVRAQPNLPRMFVDPMRIEQVLTNLVSNAIKYGDEQSDIIVDVKQRTGEIEIAVTNHGRGIPPDELPRLFNRFERSRTTRGSGVRGLGLGLYIAKGVIQAHGGQLSVESVPGKTTTFRITLRVSPEQQEAA